MLDWISVTEHMPENMDDVAIFIPAAKVGTREIYIAGWMDCIQKWAFQVWFADEKSVAKRITHWAKLSRP